MDPYQNIDVLIDLYRGGDLPEDELAFPYYIAPGKIAWAHRDELKKLSLLGDAYPKANTQKAKK